MRKIITCLNGVRQWIAMSILIAGAYSSRADDGQEKEKFYLKADGTVEKRVEKVETKVASLEARVADLEKKLAAANAPKLGSTSPVVPGAAFPVNPNFQPVTVQAAPVQYMTVCQNGVCRLVPVSGFSGGTTSTTGTPCPTGPCGDNCNCVSASALSSYPLAGTSYTTTYGTSYSNVSGQTGSGGFFQTRPRLFGRVRAGASGSACASCGQ